MKRPWSLGETTLAVAFVFGVVLYLIPVPTRDLPAEASGSEDGGAPQAASSPQQEPIETNSRSTAEGVSAPPAEWAERSGLTIEDYDLEAERATSWLLPGRLREISGLAMTPDARLLAHNDEKGSVYEVDFRLGSIVKSFALSDGTKRIAGDFEGIALAGDRVYMVTSDGDIFEFAEGADGESVPYTAHRTGVGRDHEIEGLAFDPVQRHLVLMSKEPRRKAQSGSLVMYHWSIDTQQLVPEAHVSIRIKDLADPIGKKNFRPSGIERNPVTGNYVIVAAKSLAVAEVDANGRVLSTRLLPKKWHRQAEGITFGPDGRLIVSDEGSGKRGRITVYPFRK